jgi:hypothetical protein
VQVRSGCLLRRFQAAFSKAQVLDRRRNGLARRTVPSAPLIIRPPVNSMGGTVKTVAQVADELVASVSLVEANRPWRAHVRGNLADRSWSSAGFEVDAPDTGQLSTIEVA